MAEGRFASVCSVEEFILEHENKNTAQKTERDVRLLERFLKTKDEDSGKIEDIPAAELNEFISEFIISVRTKDGNECEPTSLRSDTYQKTHSFAALTRSFSGTTQLVNKNRTRAFSMK